jgi:hypothetical protein
MHSESGIIFPYTNLCDQTDSAELYLAVRSRTVHLVLIGIKYHDLCFWMPHEVR